MCSSERPNACWRVTQSPSHGAATKLASQGKLKEGIGLPHDPLRYALESFLLSIRESKPAACDALSGYVTVMLAAKAAEAIRTGARVEIPAALYQV